jgi:gas vesicle protein
MTADTLDRRDDTFWIGLVMGTFVAAGVAMWLLPRAGADLRQRVAESARELGTFASGRYRQASTRVGQAVDDLMQTGQNLRHDVARTIVRGGQQIERIGTAIDAKR